MGLEAATYINQLNALWPLGPSDPVGQGDDHIRQLKATIQASFPNITGAMTATQAQLNAIATAAAPTNKVKGTGAAAAGSALTFLRSDAQLLLDLADSYNWTNGHNWSFSGANLTLNNSAGGAATFFMQLAGVGKVRYGVEGAAGGAITNSQVGDATIWSVTGITFSGNSGGFHSRFNGTSGAIELSAGLVGTPALTFFGDADTGLYRYGANVLGLAAGGAFSGWINTQGIGVIDGAVGTPAFHFANDIDTGLYRPGSNTVMVVAGGVQVGQFSYGGVVAQFSAPSGSASLPGYTFLADNNKGFYHVGANLIGAAIGGSLVGQFLPAGNGALQIADYGGSLQNVGYRAIPQNSQSANYTCVLADTAKHIYHPSGGGAGDTFTIPANGSVAYEIGTAITFVNSDSNTVAIAITTDTMTLAGSTSTGTRTLAQNGIATAIKVTATSWLISGTGLS